LAALLRSAVLADELRARLQRFYSIQLSILVLALLCLSWGASRADTFTVTNIADSGAGSLRAAIESANSNPGDDRIEFNIGEKECSAAGVCTIALDTPPPLSRLRTA
jgi:hypothetical protein